MTDAVHHGAVIHNLKGGPMTTEMKVNSVQTHVIDQGTPKVTSRAPRKADSGRWHEEAVIEINIASATVTLTLETAEAVAKALENAYLGNYTDSAVQ